MQLKKSFQITLNASTPLNSIGSIPARRDLNQAVFREPASVVWKLGHIVDKHHRRLLPLLFHPESLL